MGRNRVIYQSEALFVSEDVNSTSATDHNELIRVQGANYGFTINRTDVNQFGNLARIDSLVLEPPTVNFDFSYYLSNGKNESHLGFSTEPTAQFVSGFLEASSGKNFYIVTSDEGQDATTFENSDPYSLIGIGNAFLTDYTIDLSVGSLPTASVSFEASNINSQNGSVSAQTITGQLPAIQPEDGTIIQGSTTMNIPANTGQDGPTALRPGDIELSFPGFEGGESASGTLSNIDGGAGSFHVQSASISIPLSRSPISRLGSKFPYARVVDFPVNATMNVNAILNTLEAGNLAKIIAGCGGTESTKNVSVTLKSCEGDPAMSWTLKGATLDSESFSSSIGSNKSVDLTFGVQIGGIDDIDQGIIFSGAYVDVLPETTIYDVNGGVLDSFEGNIPLNYNFNKGNWDPHSLYIGSTVVDISGGAFYNNTNLSGILTIPKNVRYIGAAAFQDTSINGLIIENGVTGIDGSAFYGISTLSGDVSIPSSVENIGTFAFRETFNMDTLNVNSRVLGVSSFYNFGCKNLIIGPNVERIENAALQVFGTNNPTGCTNQSTSLEFIGNDAFNGHDFSGFNFNEGLTGIGQRAFQTNNLTGLLTIPDSMVSIDSYAFENNVWLTGIEINNAAASLGIGSFKSLERASGLVLGPNISSIGNVCFQGFGYGGGVDVINVTISCPTGVWNGTSALFNAESGIYTITNGHYNDYVNGSWSGDQAVAAGSILVDGGI